MFWKSAYDRACFGNPRNCTYFENPHDHVDPTQADTAQIINPDGSHWP